MIINKNITAAQATLLNLFINYIPGNVFVEDGHLKSEITSGGRSDMSSMLSALGRRFGIERDVEEEEEKTTTVYSTVLPDTPTTLWRLMRQADHTVGSTKFNVLRDTRRVVSLDMVKVSKDGLFFGDDLVATWAEGKDFIDQYEVNTVTAAYIGRLNAAYGQLNRLVDKDVVEKDIEDDGTPTITFNSELIDWLTEWYPTAGYSKLCKAVTAHKVTDRIAAIEDIVANIPGIALYDVGDLDPANVLNELALAVSAKNYCPYPIGRDGLVDFTTCLANTDLAERTTCDCGHCDRNEIVTTHGYRGKLYLLLDFSPFVDVPTSRRQLHAAEQRLNAWLSTCNVTPYTAVEAGITDEHIAGWTDLAICGCDAEVVQ